MVLACDYSQCLAVARIQKGGGLEFPNCPPLPVFVNSEYLVVGFGGILDESHLAPPSNPYRHNRYFQGASGR